MTWNFIPAEEVKRKASLILGLSGLTSSGKTYSALMLAQHLAKERGGPVIGIDTENGRMADYNEPALFPALNPYRLAEPPFEPPFSSARYSEAIHAADKAGAGCIVLDSGSDEWEGPGGVLDLHKTTLDRMAGNDQAKRDRSSLAAWAEAKPPHKAFANDMFRLNAHLIVCFRAEPKTTKKDGKIRDLGLQPICGSALPYKLRFHLLMKEEEAGGGDGTYHKVLKAYEHERHVFPPGGRVDADAAQRLIESFTRRKGGDAAAQPAETASEPDTAKPTWSFASDGSHRLECQGDAESDDAPRYLFQTLRKHLQTTASRTSRELAIVRQIAEANKDLIAGLPDRGRQEIEALVREFTPEGESNG